MANLTYYNVTSPYPGDFTKRCSLNGIEIDNNFLTLEGRDVKSISVQGNFLILTLYNGTQLKGNISSIYLGYNAGEGIDQVAFNNNKTITTNAGFIKTTQNMTVAGDGIGTYNPGDIIPQGTSVEEIIKNMLVKVYDVTPVSPTSKIGLRINASSPVETYEVGTYPFSCNVYVSYNAGQFQREGYSHSANCTPVNTHYLLNTVEFATTSASGATNYVFNQTTNQLTEGYYTFSALTDYSQSTFTPTKSDNTPSSVVIPSGTTERSDITFKAAYKYFYGTIEMNPCGNYDDIIENMQDLADLGLRSGYCEINGTTLIEYMESTAQEQSLILVLPYNYRIINYTENSFYVPVNVSDKWKEQTHLSGNNRTPLRFTYQKGGMATTYYVYILHSLVPIRYNNIEFTHT